MTYRATCPACGASVSRRALFWRPVCCGKCGVVLVRTGTIILTAPSLLLLIATTWAGVIGKGAFYTLVILNFAMVVFLFPYCARLNVSRSTSAAGLQGEN